ncbi:MAG: hypothetical protein AABO41_11230 [Acidobacteriota bacterium]
MAIASIMLVFVGFMIMKVEGLPSETSNTVIDRYRLVSKCGLIPVVVQTLVSLAAYLWLFHPTVSALFYSWTIGFVFALALFVGYAALVTLKL